MSPRLILALALACLWIERTALVGAERPAKPNFVVINIDDLGYADVGPFGSQLNRTPHLDRLAQEGCKLTCFYAAPVCSPSRAALMTGCYPKRVLPIPGVLFPAGAVGLHPEEATIADLLREAGYATGCIGKWHLGDQPEFLPARQGFDYYLGIPYSNDMGPAAEGAKSSLGAPLPTKPEAPRPGIVAAHGGDETGLKGDRQPPLPLLEQDRVIARINPGEQQAIVERYTAATERFIEQHRDRPFFLYLPHTAVHFPVYPGAVWAGKSPHGYYSDWIEEVDASVGRVLNLLRERGLAERTLVLFTSDNGGTPRAVNTPLRGNKSSTWEGGMRVPTIAWWPGQIPAGTSSDAITGMIDVLPTLVHLAGGTLPAERRLDGANLWPLLSGATQTGPHDVFYFYRGLRLEAVRSGPWKLHLGTGSVEPGNKGTPKRRTVQPNASPSEPQLYHLGNDVGERTNVVADHPDVVERLRTLATTMDADLGTDGIGPGCRPLGRVERSLPWITPDGVFRVISSDP